MKHTTHNKRSGLIRAIFMSMIVPPLAIAGHADELETGVRGLATWAPEEIKIDGDLAEFVEAFSTPVNYTHDNFNNRAAQFFYMWNNKAFYAALRTCDQRGANFSPDDRLWGGDGVEWYFDTRRDNHFRGRFWGPGAVHMYWTGYTNAQLTPRWCLRPDMPNAITGDGVEVAVRQRNFGIDLEFKLPWKNFPEFKPDHNKVIALDAELCYSDGADRVDRTFVYGSPLSVQQPSSQAKIQLIDELQPAHWKSCGAVMMPVRCETHWKQEEKAMVTGMMAIPPNQHDRIGKIVFRLIGTEGQTLGEYEAQIKTLQKEGGFYRAEAQWPIDAAVPGQHTLLGLVYDKQGHELTRVAPRMVSVGMMPGH